MAGYNFKKIEKKWREKWEREKIYQVDLDKAKKPFYNLMMFPYPSAEGLHIGNMYAFVHSDAYGRFMRLKGYDVFEPIGLDGFGIHSENYAIKIGEHIRDVSRRTEKNFYNQLQRIGNQYDWTRTLETYKPNYYKWTQWLFLKMYERGLAYRKKAFVNWCPSCKTVLADEQVIAGCCERCGMETEKKEMEQWFWKITEYAERLLRNLEWIDWSEEVKIAQKNWIGRSEGAIISFPVLHQNFSLDVFTTRPDTLFGCTYLVIAPEHQFFSEFKSQILNLDEVRSYITAARKKTFVERTAEGREKTGVRIEGLVAVNPINKKELPIFVADYVLPDYGTGAIMAVPAHDQRDWEFAKKFNLPIIEVVKGGDVSKEAYEKEGINVNSGFLDGLNTQEAKTKIIAWLEKEGFGYSKVVYKLRDWCISRQRYWGPPIPMVECSKCGWVPVPEKDLPVLLPEIDNFLPDGSGRGPLNKVKEFVNTSCPRCGGSARRETDVSDPFVDSSWYYLRYLCTEFENKALDKKRLKKWMPVDMYIGGKEHSVLHLLYSRFVSMVLYDLGYLFQEEPFEKFRAHGLLIREGAKISKSKGNVVNPDEYIEKFGVDAVRLYLMFLGDMRQGGDWREEGIKGLSRFVNRVWNFFNKAVKDNSGEFSETEKKIGYKTIKKVEEDIKRLKFNTAIAAIMEYVNFLQGFFAENKKIGKKSLEILAKILAPFAPHLAEEMWSILGYEKSIHLSSWPKYDPEKIKEETFDLVVQINSKFRGVLKAARNINQEKAEHLIFSDQRFQKYLNNQKVKKVIFVPNRIINILLE